MPAEIKLSNGQVALVDDADVELVSAYHWHTKEDAQTIYAQAMTGRKSVLMHRLIMNAQKGELVDHKDFNGLNNTRDNLRIITTHQHSHRRHSNPNSTGYRGVARTESGKYTAHASLRRSTFNSPRYLTVEEAARAYDRAVLSEYGELAMTNFPHSDYI